MDTTIYNGDYEAEYRVHRRNLAEKNRFYRHRRDNLLQVTDPQPRERVLDLGCGIGTVSFILSAAGCCPVGLDISQQAVRMARELAPADKPAPSFVVGDINLLPFKPGVFDKIVAADLTEHLDEATLDTMLAECYTSIKPDGTLALYTPSPTHLFEVLKKRNILIRNDPSHIGLRSMRVIREKLTAARFTTERSFFAPTHIPAVRQVERLLSRLPVVGGLFRRRVCIAARKN